jgi:hypothetical protein
LGIPVESGAPVGDFPDVPRGEHHPFAWAVGGR